MDSIVSVFHQYVSGTANGSSPMDSIVSVFHQYVSGTANGSSCDVRDLCWREDQ